LLHPDGAFGHQNLDLAPLVFRKDAAVRLQPEAVRIKHTSAAEVEQREFEIGVAHRETAVGPPEPAPFR